MSYKKQNKDKKSANQILIEEIADLITNNNESADLSYMHSTKLNRIPIKLTTGKPYSYANTIMLIGLQQKDDSMKIPAFVTFNEYSDMFKSWLKDGIISKEEVEAKGIDPERPLKGKKSDAFVIFSKKSYKEGDKFFKRVEVVDGKKKTRYEPTKEEIKELKLEEIPVHTKHAIWSVNHLYFPEQVKAQYPIFAQAEALLDKKMSPEDVDLQLRQHAIDLLESSGIPYSFSDGIETAHYGHSDFIGLGAEDRFKSHRKMLSVAAHELGHATGHKDRLNRSSLYNYSNERGYEEAVAEIHAMLVCRSFGVNSLPEHANYVKGWLGEDKNAYKLKKAAFEAYKAFEYTMEKYELYMKNKLENVSEFVEEKKEQNRSRRRARP